MKSCPVDINGKTSTDVSGRRISPLLFSSSRGTIIYTLCLYSAQHKGAPVLIGPQALPYYTELILICCLILELSYWGGFMSLMQC